ncbi:hypothetical protein HDU76_002769 [Blyttiomyces sp. JEL0837]|nr:hypothetical protein HDU76_002769 [Blyttiomyces sp. JEL0837]
MEKRATRGRPPSKAKAVPSISSPSTSSTIPLPQRQLQQVQQEQPKQQPKPSKVTKKEKTSPVARTLRGTAKRSGPAPAKTAKSTKSKKSKKDVKEEKEEEEEEEEDEDEEFHEAEETEENESTAAAPLFPRRPPAEDPNASLILLPKPVRPELGDIRDPCVDADRIIRGELFDEGLPLNVVANAYRGFTNSGFVSWALNNDPDLLPRNLITKDQLQRLQIVQIMSLASFGLNKHTTKFADPKNDGIIQRIQAMMDTIKVLKKAVWNKATEGYYKVWVDTLVQAFVLYFMKDGEMPDVEAFFESPYQGKKILSPLEQKHVALLHKVCDQIENLPSGMLLEKTFPATEYEENLQKYLSAIADKMTMSKDSAPVPPTPNKSGKRTQADDAADQQQGSSSSKRARIQDDDDEEEEPEDADLAPLNPDRLRRTSALLAEAAEAASGSAGARGPSTPAKQTRGSLLDRQEDAERLRWSDQKGKGPANQQAGPSTPQAQARALPLDYDITQTQLTPREKLLVTAIANQVVAKVPTPDPQRFKNELQVAIREDHLAIIREDFEKVVRTRVVGEKPIVKKVPKKRVKWSEEELRALEKGMMEFGTNWALIEKKYGKGVGGGGVLATRNQVALKDKARVEKNRRRKNGIPLGIFHLGGDRPTGAGEEDDE